MAYTNPSCLNCGAELVEDDVYDHSDHDDYCVGHCPECDTEYQWVSVYKFVKHTDLQVID